MDQGLGSRLIYFPPLPFPDFHILQFEAAACLFPHKIIVITPNPRKVCFLSDDLSSKMLTIVYMVVTSTFYIYSDSVRWVGSFWSE